MARTLFGAVIRTYVHLGVPLPPQHEEKKNIYRVQHHCMSLRKSEAAVNHTILGVSGAVAQKQASGDGGVAEWQLCRHGALMNSKC